MSEGNQNSDTLSNTNKKQNQLKLVMSHVTINMAVSIMTFTTRGELLKQVFKSGDYTQVGKIMSYWTGITAAVEFLLNPTVGKLSDSYGRKPL